MHRGARPGLAGGNARIGDQLIGLGKAAHLHAKPRAWQPAGQCPGPSAALPARLGRLPDRWAFLLTEARRHQGILPIGLGADAFTVPEGGHPQGIDHADLVALSLQESGNPITVGARRFQTGIHTQVAVRREPLLQLLPPSQCVVHRAERLGLAKQ